MRLIDFTDVQDRPVWVNPERVRYIRPDYTPGRTYISFDPESGVIVKAALIDVARLLDPPGD